MSTETGPAAFFRLALGNSADDWPVTHVRTVSGNRVQSRAELEAGTIGGTFRDYDLSDENDVAALARLLPAAQTSWPNTLRFHLSVDGATTWSRTLTTSSNRDSYLSYFETFFGDERASLSIDAGRAMDLFEAYTGSRPFYDEMLNYTGTTPARRDVSFPVFWNYEAARHLWAEEPKINVPDDSAVYWRTGRFAGDDKPDTLLFNNEYGLIHGIDPVAPEGNGLYLILEGYSGPITAQDFAGSGITVMQVASLSGHENAGRDELRGGSRDDVFEVDSVTSTRAEADLLRFFNAQGNDSLKIDFQTSGSWRDRIRIEMTDATGDGVPDTVIHRGAIGDSTALAVIDGWSDGLYFKATDDPRAVILMPKGTVEIDKLEEPEGKLVELKVGKITFFSRKEYMATDESDLFVYDDGQTPVANAQWIRGFRKYGDDRLDMGSVHQQIHRRDEDVDLDGKMDTVLFHQWAPAATLQASRNAGVTFVLLDFTGPLGPGDFLGSHLNSAVPEIF